MNFKLKQQKINTYEKFDFSFRTTLSYYYFVVVIVGDDDND